MSLDFKTKTLISDEDLEEHHKLRLKTEKLSLLLSSLLSWLSLGLSLVGFTIGLWAVMSIHPAKAVEITCDPGMKDELQGSADDLERVRVDILKNNTIK